jgi:AMP-binding enzyme/Phosphopantetheine attachment site
MMVRASMMSTAPLSRAVGVVVGNQVGYVHHVFGLLEQGRCVVLLHDAAEAARLPHLGIERVDVPAPSLDSWSWRGFAPQLSDEPALISFTSGTEGRAKAVVVSHRALASTVTRLNEAMGVDAGIREYVGVPVHHSFGFGRCRAVASAGGAFYVPPGGFNPGELRRMLQAGEINAISTVPSLWRVLLAHPEVVAGVAERVRFIEIGSQLMSADEKAALCTLFPRAAILQHYGLTEASRATMLRVDQAGSEELGSVGRAVGDTAVRIVEGRIAVRGPHVALGYATEAGIEPVCDAEGWFLTKDLGRVERGCLFYEGRADDVINCGGLKVQPEALEAAVRARLSLEGGFAVARRRDPLRGEAFLLAYEPALEPKQGELVEATVAALAELGISARDAVALAPIPSLPRTAVGKIRRAELSRWYAELAPAKAPVPVLGNATSVAEAFAKHLRLGEVDPAKSFVDLGGDSLSYVQLGMELERILGPMRPQWEHRSIAALSALPSAPGDHRAIDTSVLVRALGILGVVTNHAGLLAPRYIEGGALLLLVTAGANFARFQLPTLAKGELWRSLSSLVQNLALPYLVVVGLFQLLKRDFEPSLLFGYSNFVDPSLLTPFPVWFLQVLMQIIAGFALLFVLAPVRALARKAPFRLALGLHGAALLAAVFVPRVWDTAPLWHSVPHCVLWYFTLGLCVHEARTVQSRWGVSILVLLSQVASPELHVAAVFWTVLGGLLLLWLPSVRLPAPITRAAQQLAAATYFVYLTHLQVIRATERALGQTPWVSLLGFAVSLGFGLLLSQALALRVLRRPPVRAIVPA